MIVDQWSGVAEDGLGGDLDEPLRQSLQEVAEALELAATDPYAAAKLLDQWADKLHALAEELRAQGPMSSHGGMGERVRMKVIGPDGQPKGAGGTRNS